MLLLFSLLTLLLASCGGDSGIDGSSTDVVYAVVSKGSIAVPVGNPVGFAFDNNDNIWIMSGVHNGSSHRLTCFNPTTGAILASYVYQNLIEALGTGVYGITSDGTSIWISVAGNTNKLVQVNPATGQIIRNMSSTSILGPTDLSWDGTNLWISSGTGEIDTINPNNGQRTHFLSRGDRESGIAYHNGEVWVSNMFDRKIVVYDAANKTKIDEITTVGLPTTSWDRRLEFHNDQLIVLTSAGLDFYQVTKKQ
jgi:streptogramin lyase